jgi:transcription elongation factor GreA
VTIQNKTNGSKFTYTIVAEEEANLNEGKISVDSPIAKGLLGKKVGQSASVQAPAGKINFKILDIS